MTVAHTPDGRIANDAYLTPPTLALAMARAIGEVVNQDGQGIDLIVEPSAGAGAFCQAARSVWPESLIAAVEIEEGRREELSKVADDVTIGRWEDFEMELPIDTRTLIIGNPPYSLAEEHIELALRRSEQQSERGRGSFDFWTAFLLRGSWLAGQDRFARFWGEKGIGGLSHVWHVVGRPSFNGKGADQSEYVVALWRVGWHGPYEGNWLVWR